MFATEKEIKLVNNLNEFISFWEVRLKVAACALEDLYKEISSFAENVKDEETCKIVEEKIKFYKRLLGVLLDFNLGIDGCLPDKSHSMSIKSDDIINVKKLVDKLWAYKERLMVAAQDYKELSKKILDDLAGIIANYVYDISIK